MPPHVLVRTATAGLEHAIRARDLSLLVDHLAPLPDT
jgi:hypothetical protein